MNQIEINRVKSVSWLYAQDSYDGFYLIRRNDDGQRQRWTCPHFQFYFYINEEDIDLAKPVLAKLKLQTDVHGQRQSPWVKIYVENRYGQTNPRDTVIEALTAVKVKTYEGDLNNWERFCIDNSIQSASNHRIAYFDIETDDRQSLEVGRDQIVSVGITDRDDNEFFYCDDDESSMLQNAFDTLNKYDIIVSYNGERFDHPYLDARAKLHGLRGISRSTVHIDMYKRFELTLFRYGPFQAYYGIRSWRLDDVAGAVVGEHKIQHEQRIWDLFTGNRDLLREYNLQDCRLTKKLDDKLNVVKVVQLESERTGRFITRMPRVGTTLDYYILREGNAHNVHYPTLVRKWQKHGGKDSDEIKGGFVLPAKRGLHENVYVFDYSSMYPNIIMNWNISPETYVDTPGPDDYVTVTGHGFNKAPGIFSNAIKMWLDERQKYKNIIRGQASNEDFEAKNASMGESIVKELSNAMFGIFAQQSGRYYKREIAESITLTGQWLLRETIAYFESHGGTVISADTDGIAVSFASGIDPFAIRDNFEQQLSTKLQQNYRLTTGQFTVKHEQTYKRFLMVNKKNYAGLMPVDKDGIEKTYIRGLQTVKRNTVPIAARAQRELIEMFLRDGIDLERTKSLVQKWLDVVFTGDVKGDDLIIYQRVVQEEYNQKSLPLHARVAEEYHRDNQELFTGQEVRYIIVSHKPALVAMPWYKYDMSKHGWDRQYYWTNRILSTLMNVLEAACPDFPWKIYESCGSQGEIQGVLL